MAVEFPPALAGLLKALAGMDPPQGNEDELRLVGELHEITARDLTQLKSLILQLLTEIKVNWSGQSADQFVAQIRPFVLVDELHDSTGESSDYLGAAATAAEELGRYAKSTANQVEYMKWTMIGILAWALAELIYLAATAFFNWSAPFEMAMVRLMTRLAINRIVARVVASVVTQSAMGMVVGLLMDAIIQLRQMADGNRTAWGFDETLAAVEFGLLTGVVGGVLTGGGGPMLSNLLGRTFGRDFTTSMTRDFNAVIRDPRPQTGSTNLQRELAQVFGTNSHALVRGFGPFTVRTGSREVDDLGIGGGAKIPGPGARVGDSVLPQDMIQNLAARLRTGTGEHQANAMMADYLRLLSADRSILQDLGPGAFTRRVTGPVAGFIETMGLTFHRNFGSKLGENLARDLGRDYAETFARAWAKKDVSTLKSELRTLLADFRTPLGAATVRNLSDDVPDVLLHNLRRNLGGTLGFKVGQLTATGVIGGTTMVLSTGFYNLMFGPEKSFETGVAAFGAGALTGMLSHAGRTFVVEPIHVRHLPPIEGPKPVAAERVDQLDLTVRGTETESRPLTTGDPSNPSTSGAGGDDAPPRGPGNEPVETRQLAVPGEGDDSPLLGSGDDEAFSDAASVLSADGPEDWNHLTPLQPLDLIDGAEPPGPVVPLDLPTLDDRSPGLSPLDGIRAVPPIGDDQVSLFSLDSEASLNDLRGGRDDPGFDLDESEPLLGERPPRDLESLAVPGDQQGYVPLSDQESSRSTRSDEQQAGPDSTDPVAAAGWAEPLSSPADSNHRTALDARRQRLVQALSETYRLRLEAEESFALAAPSARETFDVAVAQARELSSADRQTVQEAETRLWLELEAELKSDHLSNIDEYWGVLGPARWQSRVETLLADVPTRLDQAVQEVTQLTVYRERLEKPFGAGFSSGNDEAGPWPGEPPAPTQREREAWGTLESGLRDARTDPDGYSAGSGEHLLGEARDALAAGYRDGYREHSDRLFAETLDALRNSGSPLPDIVGHFPAATEVVKYRFGTEMSAPDSLQMHGEADFQAAVDRFETQLRMSDEERREVLAQELALQMVASETVHRAHARWNSADPERMLPQEALDMVSALTAERFREIRDTIWNPGPRDRLGTGTFEDEVFNLHRADRSPAEREAAERRIEQMEQRTSAETEQIVRWIEDQYLLRNSVRGAAQSWADQVAGRTDFGRNGLVSDEVMSDLFEGYRRDTAFIDHHLFTDRTQDLRAILDSDRAVVSRPAGPGDPMPPNPSGFRGSELLGRYLPPIVSDLRDGFGEIPTPAVRTESTPVDQSEDSPPSRDRPSDQLPASKSGSDPEPRPRAHREPTQPEALPSRSTHVNEMVRETPPDHSSPQPSPPELHVPPGARVTRSQRSVDELLGNAPDQIRRDQEFLRERWRARGESERAIEGALSDLARSAGQSVRRQQVLIEAGHVDRKTAAWDLGFEYQNMVERQTPEFLRAHRAIEKFELEISDRFDKSLRAAGAEHLTQLGSMYALKVAESVVGAIRESAQRAWAESSVHHHLPSRVNTFEHLIGLASARISAGIDHEIQVAAQLQPVSEVLSLYQNGLISYYRAVLASQRAPFGELKVIPDDGGITLQPARLRPGQRTGVDSFEIGDQPAPRTIKVHRPERGHEVTAQQVADFIRDLPEPMRPTRQNLVLPPQLSWGMDDLTRLVQFRAPDLDTISSPAEPEVAAPARAEQDVISQQLNEYSGFESDDGNVWVGDQRLDWEDPLYLEPGVAALVQDQLPREFNDQEELLRFARGETDYLGNLPGPRQEGSWVRFSPDRPNIIGEDHTQITFSQVLQAVRGNGPAPSFLMERFPVEDLSVYPTLNERTSANLGSFVRELGLDPANGLAQYGLDSQIAKIGLMAAHLDYALANPEIFPQLTGYSDHLMGGVLVDVLLIRSDIARSGSNDLMGSEVSRAEWNLTHLGTVHEQVLAAFFNENRPTSFLAHLNQVRSRSESYFREKLIPALRQLASRTMELMRARLPLDPLLTEHERNSLALLGDNRTFFSEWREYTISAAIRRARTTGVRYIGMGALHLRRRLAMSEFHELNRYDLSATGTALAMIEEQNRRLRQRGSGSEGAVRAESPTFWPVQMNLAPQVGAFLESDVRVQSSDDTSSAQNNPVDSPSTLSGSSQRGGIWVADSLLPKDHLYLQDPAIQRWAQDGQEHRFESFRELAEFARKQTDHLGNIKGPIRTGEWLRFSETGSNIVGEDHEQVTLAETLRTVFGDRTFSFTDESIPNDDLSESPGLRALLAARLSERFRAFRFDPGNDWREVGGESIYPKMAWAVSRIRADLEQGGAFEDLSSQYWGARALEMLHLAWTHASDVAQQSTVAARQGEDAGAQRDLGQVWQDTRADLAPFLASALAGQPHRPLGQALDAWRDAIGAERFDTAFLPKLKRMLDGFTTAMWDRLGRDESLSPAEKEQAGSAAGPAEAFLAWRDFSIAAAARDAVARGVRYIGMGAAHARTLKRENLVPGAHFHDLSVGPLSPERSADTEGEQGGPESDREGSSVRFDSFEGRDETNQLLPPSAGPVGGTLPPTGVLWVGGDLVGAGHPLLADPEVRALLGDGRTRRFEDGDELKRFLRGETDHLGNLSGGESTGTWLRFSPSHTNLIGESHFEVTLWDVLRAVTRPNGRPPAFIYEGIMIEDLSEYPTLRAQVIEGYREDFLSIGQSVPADVFKSGGDSLFAKMGWSASFALFELQLHGEWPAPRSVGELIGEIVLRMLPAYVADIRRSGPNFLAGEEVGFTERALLEFIDRNAQVLEPLFAAQLEGTRFGTAIREIAERGGPNQDQELTAALRSLLEHSVAALRARMPLDPLLTAAQRRHLEANVDDWSFFADWREQVMTTAIRRAVDRRIRYVGLGNEHITPRVNESLIPGTRFFDLTNGGAERAIREVETSLGDSFRDLQEWTAYDAGQTDHLGSVEGGPEDGRWLRFPEAGTTVIGENHARLPLPKILAAVSRLARENGGGLPSFRYEAIAVEDLSDLPQLNRVYRELHSGLYQDLGLTAPSSLHEHGADSMFAQIGWGASMALAQLASSAGRRELSGPGYWGSAVYRLFALGLAYAEDVGWEGFPEEVRAEKGILELLLGTEKLEEQRFLGNALDGLGADFGAGSLEQRILPALRGFAVRLIEIMRGRVALDPYLTSAQQEQLTAMNDADMFLTWRDLVIAEAARRAIAEGVRYFGVGGSHLQVLQSSGVLDAPNVHVRDLSSPESASRSDLAVMPEQSSVGAAGLSAATLIPGSFIVSTDVATGAQNAFPKTGFAFREAVVRRVHAALEKVGALDPALGSRWLRELLDSVDRLVTEEDLNRLATESPLGAGPTRPLALAQRSRTFSPAQRQVGVTIVATRQIASSANASVLRFDVSVVFRSGPRSWVQKVTWSSLRRFIGGADLADRQVREAGREIRPPQLGFLADGRPQVTAALPSHELPQPLPASKRDKGKGVLLDGYRLLREARGEDYAERRLDEEYARNAAHTEPLDLNRVPPAVRILADQHRHEPDRPHRLTDEQLETINVDAVESAAEQSRTEQLLEQADHGLLGMRRDQAARLLNQIWQRTGELAVLGPEARFLALAEEHEHPLQVSLGMLKDTKTLKQARRRPITAGRSSQPKELNQDVTLSVVPYFPRAAGQLNHTDVQGVKDLVTAIRGLSEQFGLSVETDQIARITEVLVHEFDSFLGDGRVLTIDAQKGGRKDAGRHSRRQVDVGIQLSQVIAESAIVQPDTQYRQETYPRRSSTGSSSRMEGAGAGLPLAITLLSPVGVGGSLEFSVGWLRQVVHHRDYLTADQRSLRSNGGSEFPIRFDYRITLVPVGKAGEPTGTVKSRAVPGKATMIAPKDLLDIVWTPKDQQTVTEITPEQNDAIVTAPSLSFDAVTEANGLRDLRRTNLPKAITTAKAPGRHNSERISHATALQRDLIGMLEGRFDSALLRGTVGSEWTALNSTAMITHVQPLGVGSSANMRSARVSGQSVGLGQGRVLDLSGALGPAFGAGFDSVSWLAWRLMIFGGMSWRETRDVTRSSQDKQGHQVNHPRALYLVTIRISDSAYLPKTSTWQDLTPAGHEIQAVMSLSIFEAAGLGLPGVDGVAPMLTKFDPRGSQPSRMLPAWLSQGRTPAGTGVNFIPEKSLPRELEEAVRGLMHEQGFGDLISQGHGGPRATPHGKAVERYLNDLEIRRRVTLGSLASMKPSRLQFERASKAWSDVLTITITPFRGTPVYQGFWSGTLVRSITSHATGSSLEQARSRRIGWFTDLKLRFASVGVGPGAAFRMQVERSRSRSAGTLQRGHHLWIGDPTTDVFSTELSYVLEARVERQFRPSGARRLAGPDHLPDRSRQQLTADTRPEAAPEQEILSGSPKRQVRAIRPTVVTGKGTVTVPRALTRTEQSLQWPTIGPFSYRRSMVPNGLQTHPRPTLLQSFGNSGTHRADRRTVIFVSHLDRVMDGLKDLAVRASNAEFVDGYRNEFEGTFGPEALERAFSTSTTYRRYEDLEIAARPSLSSPQVVTVLPLGLFSEMSQLGGQTSGSGSTRSWSWDIVLGPGGRTAAFGSFFQTALNLRFGQSFSKGDHLDFSGDRDLNFVQGPTFIVFAVSSDLLWQLAAARERPASTMRQRTRMRREIGEITVPGGAVQFLGERQARRITVDPATGAKLLDPIDAVLAENRDWSVTPQAQALMREQDFKIGRLEGPSSAASMASPVSTGGPITTLEPPPYLQGGPKVSLGAGLPVEVPDLTYLLDRLIEQMGPHAAALFPGGGRDTKDNRGLAALVLGEDGVAGFLQSMLDGGMVVPLASYGNSGDRNRLRKLRPDGPTPERAASLSGPGRAGSPTRPAHAAAAQRARKHRSPVLKVSITTGKAQFDEVIADGGDLELYSDAQVSHSQRRGRVNRLLASFTAGYGYVGEPGQEVRPAAAIGPGVSHQRSAEDSAGGSEVARAMKMSWIVGHRVAFQLPITEVRVAVEFPDGTVFEVRDSPSQSGTADLGSPLQPMIVEVAASTLRVARTEGAVNGAEREESGPTQIPGTVGPIERLQPETTGAEGPRPGTPSDQAAMEEAVRSFFAGGQHEMPNQAYVEWFVGSGELRELLLAAEPGTSSRSRPLLLVSTGTEAVPNWLPLAQTTDGFPLPGSGMTIHARLSNATVIATGSEFRLGFEDPLGIYSPSVPRPVSTSARYLVDETGVSIGLSPGVAQSDGRGDSGSGPRVLRGLGGREGISDTSVLNRMVRRGGPSVAVKYDIEFLVVRRERGTLTMVTRKLEGALGLRMNANIAREELGFRLDPKWRQPEAEVKELDRTGVARQVARHSMLTSALELRQLLTSPPESASADGSQSSTSTDEEINRTRLALLTAQDAFDQADRAFQGAVRAWQKAKQVVDAHLDSRSAESFRDVPEKSGGGLPTIPEEPEPEGSSETQAAEAVENLAQAPDPLEMEPSSEWTVESTAAGLRLNRSGRPVNRVPAVPEPGWTTVELGNDDALGADHEVQEELRRFIADEGRSLNRVLLRIPGIPTAFAHRLVSDLGIEIAFIAEGDGQLTWMRPSGSGAVATEFLGTGHRPAGWPPETSAELARVVRELLGELQEPANADVDEALVRGTAVEELERQSATVLDLPSLAHPGDRIRAELSALPSRDGFAVTVGRYRSGGQVADALVPGGQVPAILEVSRTVELAIPKSAAPATRGKGVAAQPRDLGQKPSETERVWVDLDPGQGQRTVSRPGVSSEEVVAEVPGSGWIFLLRPPGRNVVLASDRPELLPAGERLGNPDGPVTFSVSQISDPALAQAVMARAEEFTGTTALHLHDDRQAAALMPVPAGSRRQLVPMAADIQWQPAWDRKIEELRELAITEGESSGGPVRSFDVSFDEYLEPVFQRARQVSLALSDGELRDLLEGNGRLSQGEEQLLERMVSAARPLFERYAPDLMVPAREGIDPRPSLREVLDRSHRQGGAGRDQLGHLLRALTVREQLNPNLRRPQIRFRATEFDVSADVTVLELEQVVRLVPEVDAQGRALVSEEELSAVAEETTQEIDRIFNRTAGFTMDGRTRYLRNRTQVVTDPQIRADRVVTVRAGSPPSVGTADRPRENERQVYTESSGKVLAHEIGAHPFYLSDRYPVRADDLLERPLRRAVLRTVDPGTGPVAERIRYRLPITLDQHDSPSLTTLMGPTGEDVRPTERDLVRTYRSVQSAHRTKLQRGTDEVATTSALAEADLAQVATRLSAQLDHELRRIGHRLPQADEAPHPVHAVIGARGLSQLPTDGSPVPVWLGQETMTGEQDPAYGGVLVEIHLITQTTGQPTAIGANLHRVRPGESMSIGHRRAAGFAVQVPAATRQLSHAAFESTGRPTVPRSEEAEPLSDQPILTDSLAAPESEGDQAEERVPDFAAALTRLTSGFRSAVVHHGYAGGRVRQPGVSSAKAPAGNDLSADPLVSEIFSVATAEALASGTTGARSTTFWYSLQGGVTEEPFRDQATGSIQIGVQMRLELSWRPGNPRFRQPPQLLARWLRLQRVGPFPEQTPTGGVELWRDSAAVTEVPASALQDVAEPPGRQLAVAEQLEIADSRTLADPPTASVLPESWTGRGMVYAGELLRELSEQLGAEGIELPMGAILRFFIGPSGRTALLVSQVSAQTAERMADLAWLNEVIFSPEVAVPVPHDSQEAFEVGPTLAGGAAEWQRIQFGDRGWAASSTGLRVIRIQAPATRTENPTGTGATAQAEPLAASAVMEATPVVHRSIVSAPEDLFPAEGARAQRAGRRGTDRYSLPAGTTSYAPAQNWRQSFNAGPLPTIPGWQISANRHGTALVEADRPNPAVPEVDSIPTTSDGPMILIVAHDLRRATPAVLSLLENRSPHRFSEIQFLFVSTALHAFRAGTRRQEFADVVSRSSGLKVRVWSAKKRGSRANLELGTAVSEPPQEHDRAADDPATLLAGPWQPRNLISSQAKGQQTAARRGLAEGVAASEQSHLVLAGEADAPRWLVEVARAALRPSWQNAGLGLDLNRLVTDGTVSAQLAEIAGAALAESPVSSQELEMAIRAGQVATIVRALAAARRSPQELAQLSETHRRAFAGEPLIPRLRAALNGHPAARMVDFLLGGMREAVPAISVEQARELYEEMVRRPYSPDLTDDLGLNEHRVLQQQLLLAAAGVAAQVIEVRGRMAILNPWSVQHNSRQESSRHHASLIRVEVDGIEHDVVLDPVLGAGPLLLADWILVLTGSDAAVDAWATSPGTSADHARESADRAVSAADRRGSQSRFLFLRPGFAVSPAAADLGWPEFGALWRQMQSHPSGERAVGQYRGRRLSWIVTAHQLTLGTQREMFGHLLTMTALDPGAPYFLSGGMSLEGLERLISGIFPQQQFRGNTVAPDLAIEMFSNAISEYPVLYPSIPELMVPESLGALDTRVYHGTADPLSEVVSGVFGPVLIYGRQDLPEELLAERQIAALLETPPGSLAVLIAASEGHPYRGPHRITVTALAAQLDAVIDTLPVPQRMNLSIFVPAVLHAHYFQDLANASGRTVRGFAIPNPLRGSGAKAPVEAFVEESSGRIAALVFIQDFGGTVRPVLAIPMMQFSPPGPDGTTPAPEMLFQVAEGNDLPTEGNWIHRAGPASVALPLSTRALPGNSSNQARPDERLLPYRSQAAPPPVYFDEVPSYGQEGAAAEEPQHLQNRVTEGPSAGQDDESLYAEAPPVPFEEGSEVLESDAGPPRSMDEVIWAALNPRSEQPNGSDQT